MADGYGSARDRLGQTVGDRYVLHEILGAGGTAVVYRASTTAGEEVAIKILHDHLSRSDEVCQRFLREGRLGNVLGHPGVVRVLDHGITADRCPFLALEILEGESFEERRVRFGGRLPVSETLEYCDQLLAVLEVAHAKNIIHRDIKPSNLFVTSFGHLKVLDFGIARLIDDTSATATKTGQTIGTPAFMSPEQALSRPRDVDARSDLWAVGATLFTLLSGEHVHVAESSSEHLVKAATLHARSLARALRGVPENVEAFVARSLAFDKADRFPSATAMRAALAEVRANPGRAIGTSTSPPPDRTSSSDIPTLVTRRKRPHPDDRPSDLDVMSLASNPGVPSRRARRRALLPIAFAAIGLLFVGTSVGFLFVKRTPPAQANTFAHAEASPAPVETAVLPAPVAAPPPSASAAEAVTVEPPRPSTSTPARAPSAAPRSAPARPAVVKKPPPAPTTPSRKDLYRPF